MTTSDEFMEMTKGARCETSNDELARIVIYAQIGTELRLAREERVALIAQIHDLDLKIEKLVAQRARLEERNATGRADPIVGLESSGSWDKP